MADAPLPRIGIAPQCEFRGMDTFSPRAGDMRTPATLLDCVPWEHVFAPPWTIQGAAPWPTDAHFCTYTIRDPTQHPGGEKWPRCNRSLLPEIRERGAELLTTMLVLDYDNPGHRRWHEGEVQLFANALVNSARTGFPLAMQWSSFYTTRHGARLVYVLAEPIPVDEFQPYLLGVVRDFMSNGYPAMHSALECKDWTRLFRAPYVVRRTITNKGRPTQSVTDQNSWEDHEFHAHLQPHNRLDLGTIVPAEAGWGGTRSYVQELDLPKPTGDSQSLLSEINPDTGRKRGTPWYKAAKAALVGRECYPCLFTGAPIAPQGGRDNTIHKFVGSACSILVNLPGSGPEAVYALFLTPVLQLEPDHDTPDWTDVLWRAVRIYWSREAVRVAEESKEAEVEEQKVLSLGQQILEGCRTWCDHPSLRGPESEAMAWLSGHMIANVGRHYFVMTKTGQYDTMSVYREQLVARIRALGMEALIPCRAPRADGNGFRPLNAQDIVNAHSTIAKWCEGVAGGIGTMIRNIDREDATFAVRLFHRKTHMPGEFNDEVDTWLKYLGGKNYGKLCEWIGHALAIEDGPICALSIDGAAGAGKKMLASGLAECINTEAVADSGDFGKYAEGLLTTPILVVNEGFMDTGRGARDIADSFRSLVSGDPQRVEEKYKPKMTVRIPVRVLITANNANAVSVLTGGRDLSLADREALTIRLFHFTTDASAAKYLSYLGGHAYTGKKGARWIRGAAGALSDYVVAKHFMWLYLNRPSPSRGARFLVEGEIGSEVETLLRVRSGSAPEIIETLIAMIENESPQVSGIAITKDRRVYVTSNGVLRFHRTIRMTMSGRPISIKAIKSILSSLVMPDDPKYPRTITTSTGAKLTARWNELDLRMLWREAVEHGHPSERLRALCFERSQASSFQAIANAEIAYELGVQEP